MAAKQAAGAKAPAITLHGLTFTPDEGYVESWEALELQMQLADENVDNFARMRVYFALVEGMTGLTMEQIVDAAGGPRTPALDVVKVATEIIEACTPKK